MAKLKSFDERRIRAQAGLASFIEKHQDRHKIVITHRNLSVDDEVDHSLNRFIFKHIPRKDLIKLAVDKFGKKTVKAMMGEWYDGNVDRGESGEDPNRWIIEFKPLQVDLEAEEEKLFK
jgi:hypothetical protein